MRGIRERIRLASVLQRQQLEGSMAEARWGRDAAVLGALLPALALGPIVATSAYFRGVWPLTGELAWFAAVTVWSTLYGGFAGAASGWCVRRLDQHLPWLSWWLGALSGPVGALVALPVVVASVQPNPRPEVRLLLFTALVSGCTFVTLPTHALYVAVARRGRSPVTVLVVAGVLAVLATPVAAYAAFAMLHVLETLHDS
jgi:hypothetical protein